METYVIAAAAFLASVATPSLADDGKWRCTYEEPGMRSVTEITVANGKLLQVMPDGTKRIPDQVIDLGREVHWVYSHGGLVGDQEFALDIDAAALLEVALGDEKLHSCEPGD
jgi:hypothetical protein